MTEKAKIPKQVTEGKKSLSPNTIETQLYEEIKPSSAVDLHKAATVPEYEAVPCQFTVCEAYGVSQN